MKAHKTAEQVFNKIVYPTTNSKKIKKSALRCLEELLCYIDSLVHYHIKKDYSEDHLVNTIFQESSNIRKPQQLENYCRCHLYIARNWLGALISDLKANNETSHHHVIKFKSYISDFLFNIKTFIEYLERKKSKDYVFFNGIKHHGQHSATIFRTSMQLYWQSSENINNCSHSALINLSTFTLRQAIELKLQRIIGAQDIYDKTGNRLRTKLDMYSSFISENTDLITTNCHSIHNILTISKWTNKTIHKGATPYIWEQWYALTVSMHLFERIEGRQNDSWSINDPVEIIDYEKVKMRFVEYATKDESTIYCFDLRDPEVVMFSEPPAR